MQNIVCLLQVISKTESRNPSCLFWWTWVRENCLSNSVSPGVWQTLLQTRVLWFPVSLLHSNTVVRKGSSFPVRLNFTLGLVAVILCELHRFRSDRLLREQWSSGYVEIHHGQNRFQFVMNNDNVQNRRFLSFLLIIVVDLLWPKSMHFVRTLRLMGSVVHREGVSCPQRIWDLAFMQTC